MAENLGWEAGERDKKVFKELLSLLGQNRLRDQIDDRGTNWLLPRAKVALTEAEVSEQEKKNIRKMVRNLKVIRRSQPRRQAFCFKFVRFLRYNLYQMSLSFVSFN